VAVTVEESPSVLLDENDRIVECNPAARPWFAHSLGTSIWDCFPGCAPLFRPYYDRARTTGAVVAFAQYFDGYVTHVRAAPCGSRLRVSWETLAILDTTTTERLLASLDHALERLGEELRKLEREQAKGSLRIVSGGR
jgi:hypothetical protein